MHVKMFHIQVVFNVAIQNKTKGEEMNMPKWLNFICTCIYKYRTMLYYMF